MNLVCFKFTILKFTNPDYCDNIIKTLLSGYFLNTAVLGFKGKYWTFHIMELDSENKAVNHTDKATPHQSSVFHKNTCRNWIFYDEIVMNQIPQLRCITAIKPIWLIQIAPEYFNLKHLSKDGTVISKQLTELYKKSGLNTFGDFNNPKFCANAI